MSIISPLKARYRRMNIIDRYLGKTILSTIFMVLFAIAGIEIFILMIGELGDIGRSHYTVLSAFIFVLLNLPEQIYLLFPMAGLLGMLMAFGLLANHSELVVLQSSGRSPLQITCSALKTILLLLALVTLIGEVFAPKATVFANHYKEKLIQTSQNNNALAYDIWLRDKNNFIHIHEIDRQNNLFGITWYQFDDSDNLMNAYSAAAASYQNGQWNATQIKQTLFKGDSTSIIEQAQGVLPISMTPNVLLNLTQDPNDLSLGALNQSLTFHKESHSENSAFRFAFWRRIIQPLASLVMMLLAIPFIFGPLRQASNSLRLVIGISVGFCFHYANQFFGPVILLLHWPPIVGALLPTIIFGIVGIVMLYRLRS